MNRFFFLSFACFFWLSGTARAEETNCAACHTKITPNIVSDWELSQHGQNQIDCSACHGSDHKSEKDVKKARIPTPEVCAECHEEKVQEFKKGKHALAWSSMKSMPTFHYQPMEMIEGMKGCGGCHKLGLKTEAEIKDLSKNGRGFGMASCDACHTRHLFSAKEASEPQACQTCHMGFDHPQWEMYSTSKHGVRYLLKQNKTLPENAAAPKCQMCHMPGGTHTNQTAWGFLALRLPLPEDKQWAEDRATILKAVGALDPSGKPAPRLEAIKKERVVRLTQEEWQGERDRMEKTCNQCHSLTFAREELGKGDSIIRTADKLMAEAIRIVAALYKDGIIPKPKDYAYAFPDLLAFHDTSTEIEADLFVMFLEYRNRTFQGMFHMNPDYSFWYGFSEMQMTLTKIRAKAEEMRRSKK
ncbi:MAG: multiheme c-type cytochrome [bacterium]|nr:multiheme c-type cytochrome [bacterium]